MLSVAKWADSDFGYDIDFDFFAERRNIERGDGRTLFSVPTLNSGAFYSVHFCIRACEIWAVDLRKLSSLVEYERRYVTYVPSRRKQGLPTARGYCLPCDVVAEAGQHWTMPAKLAQRLDAAKTKEDAGRVTEKAFDWLVNDQKFFPTIFVGTATRSTFTDDYRHGIDFWINGQIPVQVKLDGPGGRRGTGNLFFQTHTLPVSQAEEWHDANRGG